MNQLKEFLKFYGLMFVFVFIGTMLIFESFTGIFTGENIIPGQIMMNIGFIFIAISIVVLAYFKFKHKLN